MRLVKSNTVCFVGVMLDLRLKRAVTENKRPETILEKRLQII